MKGVFGVILVLVLVASLAGCARTAGGSASTAAASPSLGQAGAGALPATTQLVVGTFKLEDGDLAVDAQQAAELLPLWKAYLTLSRSDSAVEVELETLVVQIQETMTPEQTRAIETMQLTGEDMAALIQELGITAVGAGQSAEGRASRSSGTQGRFASGGGPPGGFEGGFPGGAGGMPAGVPGMTQGGQASGVTSGTQQAAGMRMAALSPLIEALIKLLESKV